MSDCRHINKRLVWTDHNRHMERMLTRQLRYQCIDCGDLSSQQVAHHLARRDTPSVDLEKLQQQHDKRNSYWKDYRERRLAEQRAERERWWQEYSVYLTTDAWREKRKLVLERARGICEGCRRAPATQVHHLTYEHQGNEFLWELIAICNECHDRVHSVREDSSADYARA